MTFDVCWWHLVTFGDIRPNVTFRFLTSIWWSLTSIWKYSKSFSFKSDNIFRFVFYFYHFLIQLHPIQIELMKFCYRLWYLSHWIWIVKRTTGPKQITMGGLRVHGPGSTRTDLLAGFVLIRKWMNFFNKRKTHNFESDYTLSPRIYSTMRNCIYWQINKKNQIDDIMWTNVTKLCEH